MKHKTNHETAENQTDFLYLEGNPKQYRFNAQNGRFNVNGMEDKGTSLSFTPLAFRVFNGELFGRTKTLWAEFFFIDEDECISSIMFNGTSVQELVAVQRRLYYERKNFLDVKLVVTSVPKTSEKGRWHLAQFSTQAPSEREAEYNRLVLQSCKVYRLDTLQSDQDHIVNYHVFLPSEFEALPQVA